MKEKTIVLNVMLGEPGEILARGRNYLVRKLPDGRMQVEYHNISQEGGVLKLTLTALNPFSKFLVGVTGEADAVLTANAAGILESRFPVPAGKRLRIEEQSCPV